MNIFSGGTKEKCCYAVVYDKQLFLHSTVADTPIMKTQRLGKQEEGGGGDRFDWMKTLF